MAKILNSNIVHTLLFLLTWQLVHAAPESYSVASATNNGHQYAVTKDNAISDYIKGYGVPVNDFDQRQQESIAYQPEYGSTQARYGSADEQQSYLSPGYQTGYHQSTGSEAGNAYEVPHQSDINKFVDNNFSHQYEQESDAAATGGSGGGGAYEADEGASAGHTGFSTSQHHHTDVINYVPYPVVKKLHVPYSKPVQIPISHAIIIPIRKPVPIHIPITKQIQVPVEKELKIPVERLVPFPVEKQVPVPVEKHVPYPVVRYMPVKVSKPYPVKVPVVKTVVHKVKELW